jgi:hypothetical protein
LTGPWRSQPRRPLSLKGEKIWFRDLTEISRPGTGTPTKTGRDGNAKTIAFYRPKDQPKGPKIRYFLGITENSKDKQGTKIGISLEYADLFKIARVMEEAALAILGWRKEIEERREVNGGGPPKNQPAKEKSEVF